ncbi:hypothetical protein E2320_002179, partial [Naja naja]
ETIRVLAVIEDIACQLGAHLKSLSKWSGSTSIQWMERDLLGQATLSDPLINQPLTVAREFRATILEWRAATGPIGSMGDHKEPAEWQYQTAICWENLLLSEEGNLLLWGIFHHYTIHPQEWNGEGRMGLRTSSNEASPSCSPTSPTTISSTCKRPNAF